MYVIKSRGRFARRSSLFGVFLSLLLTMSSGAFAQTYNGSVRGTITDPSGAAVRGALIVLTDNATHQVRNATSDGDGAYAFNALRPSVYTLHVETSGFSPADRTDIHVSTQDSLTLDVQLLVGATTNVVKVSAEAPLIDPSTASVSTDLDQTRLEDIPVLGRNPYITAKLSGVFVNTGISDRAGSLCRSAFSRTRTAGAGP